MNPLHRAKQDYEHIQIPHDLDSLVDEAIRQSRRQNRFSMNKGLKLALSGMAGLTMMLNLSPVFAARMQDLPVVGDFFRVLTFRHIETQEERTYINAQIPAITSTGNEEMEKRLNDEIYTIITDQIEECKIRAEENWTAYLETGGDPAEERTFDFYSDYDVMYDSDNILSFVIHIEEASASVEHLNYYYNLDLSTGEALSLKEIAGDDYIEKINQSVRDQIAQREQEDPDNLYFHEDWGAFQTIQEDQNFYINQDAQLVIVFERYDIAPGYMGEQEFVMPFSITLPE